MSSTSQLNLYELHYNLGHVLHQQGDLANAAQSYRQAISLKPDYVNAHLNLAIVLDEQRQFSEAVHHYRQVLALQPDFAQAYNNLGCTLIKLQDVDAAIHTYRQAIERHPNWATLHNNLGQAIQNQGKGAEAIEAYRRAIELQPDLVLGHYNLGKLLQAQGHHAKAISFFQQAIQLDPNYLPAYSDCCASWMAQGQLSQALLYLRQAVVRQSQWIDAYCHWTAELSDRSTIATQKNEEAQGVEQDLLTRARVACGQFLHALQHQPDAANEHLAQTCLYLAHTLRRYGGEGQYRQAQTYYEYVLQLQPDQLEAHLGLADCLVKQGKQNAAILIYHLALKLCGNSLSLHVQLGQTLEQQQKFAEAIFHYRKALQAQSCNGVDAGLLVNSETTIHREEEALERLPQGIYSSTQDWIATTQLAAHYIELQFSQIHPIAAAPCQAVDSAAPSLPPGCQGLNCQPCLKRIFDRFDPIHLGKGIYSFAMANQWDTQTPLFVATIADGRVWTAPQQNHWQVCNATAVITPDRQVLADLSRNYPGQLPGCLHPDPVSSIFQLKNLPALERVNGTVAVLTGLSAHNYYHWLVDVLPRLVLLQASESDVTQIDRFLVNSVRQPFQRTTLAALGVPLEKVIASDRHPYLQAEQLVVPSFAGALGWLEPWALTFLRQQFLPLAAQRSSLSAPYPERIYISRSSATHRRVLNEAAVIEQLQLHGFVSIQLESLSFFDQIALFANARIIVAPHGGGLANLMFCQAKTIVIELANSHYIRHYFLAISQQLHLRHYLIAGEALTCQPLRQLMYPSPLMEDIWVNPEPLAALLSTLVE